MKKLLLTCTDLMAVQFFKEHIAYWVENGYQVDLACSPVGQRVEELRQHFAERDEVTVQVVDLQRSPFSLSNLKGYRQMKKLVAAKEYDCVLTNEPVMGLVTRLAARKRSAKVIYIAHGFHFFRGGSKLNNFIYKTIERFAARYTDTLVTINHEDFDAAKQFKYRKGGRAEYIPGIGVNIDRFAAAAKEKDPTVREEFGISDSDVVIAVIGELNENKRQRVAIEGLAKCKAQCPNAKLLLIGKGEKREELAMLADSLGIAERVIFAGYRRDVPRLLSACDIGASASFREGLGLNLIEEMACGLPLIGADNRGHRDIVEKDSGYLFPCDNAEGFAECLIKLYQNAELRHRMGEYNKESCRRFDIATVKVQLLELMKR